MIILEILVFWSSEMLNAADSPGIHSRCLFMIYSFYLYKMSGRVSVFIVYVRKQPLGSRNEARSWTCSPTHAHGPAEIEKCWQKGLIGERKTAFITCCYMSISHVRFLFVSFLNSSHGLVETKQSKKQISPAEIKGWCRKLVPALRLANLKDTDML